ncbi:MAG: hypothetical protein ACFE85_11760 [Candidatus Hodarchaeota archaeon]
MVELFEIITILLIIFLIIPFLILTFITIWIYKDAKKRNMNSFVWILIVWLVPCFGGLILYLKARE